VRRLIAPVVLIVIVQACVPLLANPRPALADPARFELNLIPPMIRL